jgi:hypothetical protein
MKNIGTNARSMMAGAFTPTIPPWFVVATTNPRLAARL